MVNWMENDMAKSYEEIVAEGHAKRVAHFVRYMGSAVAIGVKEDALVLDAIEIFGFCDRDARPIVKDAMKAVRVYTLIKSTG